ncbi:preprotein translocase subunit SecE [Zongyangia hominis]|uniref:Protein translocase subunit SecE n=1 Tax=Zongyangia hominis TaxID=2763677 RepID=A0A926EBR9_9FIRM|nr:preprotein translocase subunit SecE [Zongyangia hominis]MBC8570982.1 preprotein translocase subunit SecE [Zongyangia hominis]
MSSTQTKDTKKGRFSPKNIAKRIGRFFRDFKGESKKIVWPTKKQVVNNTIVVIVMMLIVGAFIWGVDALMSLLVNAFLKIA